MTTRLVNLIAIVMLAGCGGDDPAGKAICGDGVLQAGERCDDANTRNADGCSVACAIEEGFACRGGEPSVCTPECGDGMIVGDEVCDDGAQQSGDGCDAACRIEPGFDCVESPSRCCALTCDGQVVLGCDDRTVEVCEGSDVCANGACVFNSCRAAAEAQSSVGCDFWTYRPEATNETMGACFAAFVVNGSAEPAHLTVELDGVVFQDLSFIKLPAGQGAGLTYQPYDPEAGLAAGEMAALFLAVDTGGGGMFAVPCPVPPAIDSPGLAGTGTDVAFHIQSDQPVTVVSVWPFGGGAAMVSSASLLLPTAAWGTNYLAVTPFDDIIWGELAVDLVAREDDTEITLLPRVAVVGGNGVPGGPANTPIVVALDAGEVLHIAQRDDLTGSAIASSGPIGVWGSADCMNIPLTETACDGAHQQLLPTRALGHGYVGVRHRDRAMPEEPPWRIVGMVDNTSLTWQPAPPPGAPTSLSAGQVSTFVAPGPFQVDSQDAAHPFYLAQHMTGGSTADGAGDPEWVSVLPVGQYLEHYTFPTDPTFPETHLVVVRRRNAAGSFEDVTLDCAGVLGDWEAVGDHEYTRIGLTSNFVSIGTCATGPHEMSSAAPFAVAVWGWGTPTTGTGSVSYAHLAGAGVRTLNGVELPVE